MTPKPPQDIPNVLKKSEKVNTSEDYVNPVNMSVPNVETTKLCPKCKVLKPRLEFSKNRQTRDGLAWMCKKCFSAYTAEHYQQTRERIKARRREDRKNNPEKYRRRMDHYMTTPEYKAHHAVNNAIRLGKLSRQPCEVCGAEKVDFHHSNGYDEENWFVGMWLCSLHHSHEHNRMVAAAKAYYQDFYRTKHERELVEARMIELDLFEQALNTGWNMNKYKLHRLEALTAALKEEAA